MNRRQAREETFILIFQYEFRKDMDELLTDVFAVDENGEQVKQFGEQEDYVRQVCAQFVANKEQIDELIEKHSQNWKKDRISMVSLAVLRLGLCEMLFFDDIPNVVSIAEAVEIGKKFGGIEVVPFINGILEGARGELT